MSVSSNITSDHMICGYFYTAWSFLYVFVLPVFMLVIWVGLRQWRKPRSRSPSTAHSDVFTFNMAAIEVCGVAGSCILTSATYTSNLSAVLWGFNINFMVQFGQIVLHNLVCLERYLAVVHPIIYLRLKKNGAVIRNVCIVLVWLCSASMAFLHNYGNYNFNIFSMLTIVMLSLVLVAFFCARVLYVLIRPGPGERGGDGKRTDKMKRVAFCTMAAITVALLLKFVIVFAAYMVLLSKTLNDLKECLLSVSAQWLNLPSSLVLPVLFLHRWRKQRKLGNASQRKQ